MLLIYKSILNVSLHHISHSDRNTRTHTLLVLVMVSEGLFVTQLTAFKSDTIADPCPCFALLLHIFAGCLSALSVCVSITFLLRLWTQETNKDKSLLTSNLCVCSWNSVFEGWRTHLRLVVSLSLFLLLHLFLSSPFMIVWSKYKLRFNISWFLLLFLLRLE